MNTENVTKKTARLSLLRNWISLTGLVIMAGSLFSFLLLFVMDMTAHFSSPYIGILTYFVAPGFLIFGLSVTILGSWHQHRKQAKSPGLLLAVAVDLSRTRDRRVMGVFIVCAVTFLLVSAIGSYQTYHISESTQFCGRACHEPMKPEFTAYLNSPHARVACTECHVGSGAQAFVAAKVNGMHQLLCVFTGKYQRPIKTPIKNLRLAQETCEQCHWPQRFVDNLDRTYSHFLADETNTPFSVRLILKVGGGEPMHGQPGGIHWHMNLANKVEYIATDEKRQVIPWVRLTDKNGTVTEYRTKDFKDDFNKYVVRRMDCLDCHNRPAHRFSSPNDAVDRALEIGRIDRSLPWVKSNAVAVLTQTYSTEPEALEKIAGALREKYSGAAQVASLISEVQRIYSANFFPEMKADWRAYPENINHKDWAGCFRCHDGNHKAPDGKRSIQASDCNSCHTILAQGSGEQLTKLDAKGHSFFHIDAINEDFTCNSCHTGAFPKQ
jgi:nitrate/TMAO reductase-like tetraheme cytochrome c subunit